jgi:hypothetical protein
MDKPNNIRYCSYPQFHKVIHIRKQVLAHEVAEIGQARVSTRVGDYLNHDVH